MMKFDVTDQYSFLKMEMLETLRMVMDPELNVNIVDLGLVYEIDLIAEKRILISMTLSSQFCPMGEAILQSVKNCMEQHYPHYETDVSLVWEPVWSYEMISEEGLRQLGR